MPAVQQVFPDTIFQAIHAGIQPDPEHLAPCQAEARAYSLQEPKPDHATGQVVEDAGREGGIEQHQRFLVPSGHDPFIERQRGIQKRTAQSGQIIMLLRNPGKRRPRRRILEITLAEKQFHPALPDRRLIRRFFARHDQRSQQRIGYLRLIRAAPDALMSIVAVAQMIVQNAEPRLFDLRGLEFVQRLGE